MRFRPFLLVPVSVVVAGCAFFTLEEPEKAEPMGTTTGGKGGNTGSGGASGGTAGTTGGSGGSAGAMAGAGAAGTGGSAGNSGNGGTAGASPGGAAGASSGGAGTGGAGAAGAAGAGGTAGAGGGAGAAGTAGGGSGGGGPCATFNPEAQAFGGHCYYRNTTPVTWPLAKAGCEALGEGGHLVTITSQEEQTFVWNLAAMTDVWIGATDGKMESEPGDMSALFTWTTGEDIMQFNGWASGEPNNYQKACSSGTGDCWEHCGFMWVDTQGAWNDDICGYEKAYICERDSGG
jgi:hypothetical protein